jgi:uncharacterized phage infection (PIP) family protein YhgE
MPPESATEKNVESKDKAPQTPDNAQKETQNTSERQAAAKKEADRINAETKVPELELTDKPVEKPVDKAQMAKDAATIEGAFGRIYNDNDDIHNALKGKTEAELTALKDAYKEKTGRRLEDDLRDRMSGEDKDRALTYLNHKDADTRVPRGVDKEAMLAANAAIFKASDGIGTTKEDIYKALQGKTPAELKLMDGLYKSVYGMSLGDQMRGELSGSDLKKAMDLLHPPA